MYEGTRIYADGERYAISESATLTRTSTGGYVTFTFGGQTTIPISGTASAVNKAQTITIDATGGTFTITYSGQTTSALAFDAAAATVETALLALSNLDTGDVAVTGSAGGPFTLTYGGTLAGINTPTVTTDAGSLTGGAGTATVATTVVGCPGFIAADVQAAFEDLSTVGAGNIEVTGSAGGPLTVSFIGDLIGTDVGAVTVSNTNATGGTVTITQGDEPGPLTVTRVSKVSVYGTEGAVQNITRTATGGTYTITYDGQETSALDATGAATAADIQTALRALSNLTADEVAVTGSAGGPFAVTFTFANNPQSVEALVIDDDLATGGTVVVEQQVPTWSTVNDRLEWADLP